MDYYREGEKCRKDFGSINKARDFEKYVFDFVFKNAHEFNKAEFVRGLLNKTKNETLYIYATNIANRTEKNESIWSEIIAAFANLVKGKNKPQWGFSKISNWINYAKFNTHNYDVKRVVYIFLNYDGEGSSWWIKQSEKTEWFKQNKDYIKAALIEQVDTINPNKAQDLFEIFKDMYFYRRLVEGAKGQGNIVLFEVMLQKLSQFKREVDGFVGGFEIDDIMKSYPEKFRASVNSMNYISTLIAQHYTPESGKLFVDLLNTTGFKEEPQTLWLMKIKDIKSGDVYAKLYELTQDEEYLPQEAKDLFLF